MEATLSSRNQSPYIVIADHSPSAQHVFDEIRGLGYRILYLGRNRLLQSLSDRFYDLNITTDTEGWLTGQGREVKDLPVAGVYTLMEHAKFAERAIAEKLGLNPLPERTLLLGRDKLLMRECMRDAGLAIPQFHFLGDSDPIEKAPLPFPFIVKPNLGYASGGVQLVRDQAGFEEAVRTVRRLNRFVLKQGFNGESGALCEEYIHGPEFSVDSLTVGGRTRSFCVCGRGFAGDENFADYIYYSPPEGHAQILAEVQPRISSLLAAMGYTDGPSHTELRYQEETRTWYTLETALRGGFAGNIGKMVQEVFGLAYNQLSLRAHLRELPVREMEEAQLQYGKYGALYAPSTGKGGIITKVGGKEFLGNDPRIRHYFMQKDVGETVIAYPRGLEYLGVVLGVASDRAGLEELLQRLPQEVVFSYD